MLLNLYKGWDILEFPDLLIAIMIIDGTSAAGEMTLSGKETLASRLFTLWYSGLQFLSLITIFMAMSRVPKFPVSEVSCPPQVYWWGNIEAGRPVPASFWLYLCLRLVSSLHSAWLALTFRKLFDQLEKVGRGRRLKVPVSTDALELQVVNPALRNQEHGSGGTVDRHIAKESYNSVTATAFSLHWQSVPVMVSCALAAEGFLRSMRLSNVGKIQEWGQSAALVACVTAGIHVLYIYYMMWTDDVIRKRNESRASQGLAVYNPPTTPGGSRRLFFTRIWQWLRRRCPFHCHQVRSPDFVRLEAAGSDWYLEPQTVSEEERRRQNSFLLQAIKTHDRALLAMSLEAGASPDARDEDGFPGLILALEQNNDSAITLLREAGVNPDAPDVYGRTGLCVASEHGEERMIRALLHLGADVNGQSSVSVDKISRAARSANDDDSDPDTSDDENETRPIGISFLGDPKTLFRPSASSNSRGRVLRL